MGFNRKLVRIDDELNIMEVDGEIILVVMVEKKDMKDGTDETYLITGMEVPTIVTLKLGGDLIANDLVVTRVEVLPAHYVPHRIRIRIRISSGS